MKATYSIFSTVSFLIISVVVDKDSFIFFLEFEKLIDLYKNRMHLNDFHNSLLFAVGILGTGVVKSYVGFEFLSISNKFNLEIYLYRSTLFFRSLIKK